MLDLEQLMFAAILFLGVSVAFVSISSWLKLGSIFGFLAAGIALGPHSPGPVLTTHVDELLGIAEIGVVFLMFTIGLEMQPNKLWAMRRFLFGLGPLQVLAAGGAIAGSIVAISPVTGLQVPINGAIILGSGLALSSTAIVMQVLAEKGEVATNHGKAAFAVLVMQDVASVLLLILIPFLAVAAAPASDSPLWEQGGFVVAAIAGVIVVGRFFLPPVFTWTARLASTATFGVVVLIAVMAAALAMDEAGLSMAMGTFLLGVMLSASDFRYQVEASILPLKGLFMGLFFVAVGMSIDIDVAIAAGPELIVWLVVVVAIKVLVMMLLGGIFRLGRDGAIRSAFLLVPCSEFGFVLFASAKAGGLMSDHAFAIAVVLVSLSMALTPFTVKLGNWLADRFAGKRMVEAPLKEMSEAMENHVVVAGYNRTGRLMCVMLEKTDTPYIAFDLDPDRIAQGKREGLNVHYGDVTDPEMQGAAAFARAKSVVVTLEDMESAGRLVEELRNFYPYLPIQMAVPDLATQDAMQAKGVADAICNLVEGNLQLGETVLGVAGVAEADISNLIEALRQDDYALIRGVGRAQSLEAV
jgi:glutathione-regulated potassium-efflux system protein KefB